MLSAPASEIRHANFPGDHNYTLQSLVEELNLVERHIRDRSYQSCSCNAGKHLPLVAGLASEGIGFSEGDEERSFMEDLMNHARLLREDIKLRVTPEKAEEIREWARDARRRINEHAWSGEISDTSEVDNDLTVPEIEDEEVRKMVDAICEKEGVPPPKEIRFKEECNPLTPYGLHVQTDTRDADGGKVPRPDLDVLEFCRGGSSPYAVAHEAKHYVDHARGVLVADENEANAYALENTRNSLYTPPNSSKNYKQTEAMDTVSNSMSLKTFSSGKAKGVFLGYTAAKLTNKYLAPKIPTAAGLSVATVKIAAGAALLYLGLKGEDSPVKTAMTFAGAELSIGTIIDKFAPEAAAASASAFSAPIAVPMAPGNAVITAASPYTRDYSTPTQMSAGFPGVARVDGKWIDVRV